MTDQKHPTGDERLSTGLEPKERSPKPYGTILTDVSPEKARMTITLDRKRTHNAFSFQMMEEIADALEQARYNDNIKVVVFRANGPNFSSGHDMRELAMVHQPGKKLGITERINRDRRRAGEPWEFIYTFNKPIVARVHGKAIGAGAQLAVLADVTVMADNAKLFHSPVRFGGPAQDALMPLWILSAGLKRAKLVLYTGVGLSGKQAVDFGLATKSVPEKDLDIETDKIAEAIAMLPLDGLVLSKEWMNLQLSIMGVNPTFAPGYLGHALFSTVKHRDGEFNFLRTAKNEGMAQAYRLRDERYKQLLDGWPS